MPFDQIQCADLSGEVSESRRLGGLADDHQEHCCALAPEPMPLRAEAKPHVIPSAGQSRRKIIIGGAAAAAVVAVGGGWWALGKRQSTSAIPPDVATLLDQAKGSLWQNTPEGQNQAIGILRQVVSNNPTIAEGWGRLAMSYALTSHWRGSADGLLLQQRARSAAQQALAMDAHNVRALVGRAWAEPFMGNWLTVIRDVRNALSFDPKDSESNFMLAMNLSMTGASREALDHVNPVLSAGPTPGIYVWQAQMLWSAGRDDALDALLDEATKLYPTHFGVWFTRFYTAMMGGRPEMALALAANTANWPTNIDPRRSIGRSRCARDAIPRTGRCRRCHQGVDGPCAPWRRSRGKCRAIHVSARPAGYAFAVLRAYYFAEGFDPGEVRFRSRARQLHAAERSPDGFPVQPGDGVGAGRSALSSADRRIASHRLLARIRQET